MKDQRKAYILALVAVMFWSTIGSAFKITLRHLDFLHIVLYASFVSLVVFFIMMVWQRKLHLLTGVKKEEWIRSSVLGLLNPFLFYITVLKAYDLLLAQEAVVLNYVWPITLTLLSIPLLRQKIHWKSIMAILISFMGVMIIATKGNMADIHFTSVAGVLLALLCTVFWALFFIINMKDPREAVPKMFLNFAFGFIYILITALVTGPINLPGKEGWIGVVYIGIFEMGITFIIWLAALKLSITTAKVSNLIFLSPFLSLIWVSLAVGEKIMGYTLAGLVFIVAGIVLQRVLK